ncbi:Probable serine/threonine-protein kinase pknH [Nocardia otitidiscaviarum]|uniref:non-specific serine/threonine protein kinase n=1 Tax=Nocardia otitidiscaviarum TaxID=1823 RepID=A0A378YB16_9NOCA|nr:serine/threonine-protein kinase [Nocardia otitidiscaviarum]SUA73567.1 Probable serine/threonine-protein kinase pknH [Nocardia otitidiscaviarum]
MVAGARAGSRFGQYELRTLLGVGGMGEVYEAYDTVRDRVVALKLLDQELAGTPSYVERFRRESRTAARLQEPHVIPVHDWGEVDGVLYIDMRLVRGRDLKARLRAEGPLAPDAAVAVVEQIAAALDAAHEGGLVHRDIKPANILLTDDMFAYLVDFGIAYIESDVQLTNTGSAIGSFAYMAPERFEQGNRHLGAAVDTYALACVLYESLTGEVPFAADSNLAAIRAHLMTPPPRPSARPGVPATFDQVIATGMAKNPARRYTSAGQLARAARAALLRTADADRTRTTAPPTAPTVVLPAPHPNPTTRPHHPPADRHPADRRPADRRLADAGQAGDGDAEHPADAARTPGGGTKPGRAGEPFGGVAGSGGEGPPLGGTIAFSGGDGPVSGREADFHGFGGASGFAGGDPVPVGGAGWREHPSGPLPPQERQRSRLPVLVGVLGVAVVGLAAALGWVALRDDGTPDRPGAITSPVTARPSPGVPLDVTSVAQTPAAPTSTAPASVVTTPADARTTSAPSAPPLGPLPDSVSGSDGQGFVDAVGPRCNADDPAYAVGHTAASRFVVCRTGVGRYYYQGVRLSDGARIELDDPVPAADGFTVTNPADGTRYEIGPRSLTIMRDGEVLADQAMIEYASR